MRKALRRLLLKTHPDFFGRPEDAACKQDNERSLALINSLMDAATGSDETPAQFPTPTLSFVLHYRSRDAAPLRHEVAVPPWLQQGSRDTERVREFCTAAMGDLLIKAGEVVPQQAGREKKDYKWAPLPAMDFEQMKRDIYEHVLTHRDPFALHETPTQWQDRQQQMRFDYWMKRVLVHPRVTLLQSDTALTMLREFAQANPKLLPQMYDIPLFILPTEHAAVGPGILACFWGTTAEQLRKRLRTELPALRAARNSTNKDLEMVLAACDAVCAAGNWAGVSLGAGLLRGEPGVALQALVAVLRDDTQRVLENCHVHLFTGSGASSMVDVQLHAAKDGTRCAAVRIALATEDLAWRPPLQFRYELVKAKKLAQVENEVASLPVRYPVVRGLHVARTHSLEARLSALSRLRSLLDAVVGDTAAASLPTLEVRLGERGQGIKFEHAAGVLFLPMDFDMAEVGAKLRQ